MDFFGQPHTQTEVATTGPWLVHPYASDDSKASLFGPKSTVLIDQNRVALIGQWRC